MSSFVEQAMRAVAAVCCGLLLLGCGSGSEPATNVDDVVAATAVEHAGDIPEPSPQAERPPARPVLEQTLAYGEAEGGNLVGFLAMPEDAAEPLPGIVVVHEWWGLNDNIRSMTRRLAAEGYVALAVDLYDGATAEDESEAQALMARTLTESDTALANIRQAYEYLDRYAFAPRVAVIGWCLGGGLSLAAAMDLPEDLDAVVMYYGQVVTDPARLTPLQMPLLGHFGANDSSIPVRDVQQFRTALRDLGKRSEVLIYSGVGHAFANPSGGTHDAAAAEEAWSKTLKFLGENL
jgi:carboxymethylenebutenolidase